jgi:hypothetical protein
MSPQRYRRERDLSCTWIRHDLRRVAQREVCGAASRKPARNDGRIPSRLWTPFIKAESPFIASSAIICEAASRERTEIATLEATAGG